MRHFSVRPTLTFRGRKFKGLRGFSGKPTHPPLTDFPVAGYIIAAGLDVISALGRSQHWDRDFFRAGTYVFVAAAGVSVLTALTGFWDWLRSTEAGTQARRTANTHAVIMLTVTALAVADLILRLSDYHTHDHPTVVILVLSLLVAGLVGIGAAFGGTLVFDYGFNVETAGDAPEWHRSERDHLPGALTLPAAPSDATDIDLEDQSPAPTTAREVHHEAR